MPKKAVVEGDVILRSNNTLELEPFTEEFTLEDEIFEGSTDHIGTARIIIKKGLLKERLRKKHKNFKGERASQVVSLEDTKDAVEKDEHGLAALLIEATKLGCIPENIENYRRPDYKAKALQRAIEGEKKRRSKKKKSNVQDLGYVD